MLAACSGGGGGGSVQPPSTPTPTPSPTPSPITITNSGSTNTNPYEVTVNYNDAVVIMQGPKGSQTTTNATVSASSATQLFHDVILYAPMNTVMTNNGCTKSSSYGTSQTLTYQGIASGDVSCPPTSTSPAQALYTDVQSIENQLNLPY